MRNHSNSAPWRLLVVILCMCLIALDVCADIKIIYLFPSYTDKTFDQLAAYGEGGREQGSWTVRKQEYKPGKTPQTCWFYSVKPPPGGFDVSAYIWLPTVGSAHNGHMIDTTSRDQVSTHEYCHFQNFQAFVSSTLTPYDAFRSSYVTDTFQTADGAHSALDTDMQNAANEFNKWYAQYQQDSQLGHAQSVAYYDTTVPGSPLRIRNPNWNAAGLAKIQAYGPTFKKTPGDCHQ